MNKVEGVKKIAVLRANALGDFIFALPALTALKQTYSDAEIVYLGKKWHHDFLTGRPSPVDRVVVIPPFRGVSEQDTFTEEDHSLLATFFQKMQEEQFNIAVQIHGGGRNSNAFLCKLGAELTVGTRTPDAPLLDRWLPYIYYQNETLRYLEVVKLIGATTSAIVPILQINEQDTAEANEFIPNSPFVILHPGATDIRRRWSPEKFASVGDRLVNKGYKVVVTGTGDEKEVVFSVLKNMKEPALNGHDRLTLGGFAAALSKASLLISNDTGPLHLANAVGAKTIGIFWCGNIINGDPLNRLIHHPLLSWTIHCPLCGMNVAQKYPFQRTPGSCQHSVSFVDSIPTDEVLNTSLSLLQEDDFPPPQKNQSQYLS